MNAAGRAALRAAVALITADRCGLDVSQEELTGDLPDQEVIGTLTAVCAGVLDALPDGAGAQVLRTLGLVAAGDAALTPPEPR